MKKNQSLQIKSALLVAVILVLFSSTIHAKTDGSRVSLDWVKRYYGFQSLTVRDKEITLVKRVNTLSFTGNSRRVIINGVAVWLGGPIVKKWGCWRILKSDVNKTIVPLLYPSRSLVSEGYRVVVIDPGHGGKDKGAKDPWRSVEEKRVALYVAKKVRDILAKDRIDVKLTRNSDCYVSLKQRCQTAKRYRADLFVSIHLNAAKDQTASGLETYVLAPAGCPTIFKPQSNKVFDRKTYLGNRNDSANIILGFMLQKSMLKFIRGRDRGIRRSRFYVLRNVACPAALVECGFLSNRADAEKFISKAYRDKIARAIAEGICSYLNSVKLSHRIKR